MAGRYIKNIGADIRLSYKIKLCIDCQRRVSVLRCFRQNEQYVKNTMNMKAYKSLNVCGYCAYRHFNNISVISWRSVLLVEETGEPRKTTDLPLINFIT